MNISIITWVLRYFFFVSNTVHKAKDEIDNALLKDKCFNKYLLNCDHSSLLHPKQYYLTLQYNIAIENIFRVALKYT